MKTVRLITCNDAMQAHILQGALENEGIDSLLHNENFSSLLKSYVSNISGVDIFVNEEDYDHALQVLRDNQSLPEELKYCPFCGSADITFKLRKDGYMKAACAVVFSMNAGSVRPFLRGLFRLHINKMRNHNFNLNTEILIR